MGSIFKKNGKWNLIWYAKYLKVPSVEQFEGFLIGTLLSNQYWNKDHLWNWLGVALLKEWVCQVSKLGFLEIGTI